MKVLITGANGFVGGHLCRLLVSSGFDVLGTTREDETTATSAGHELRRIGDLGGYTNWGPILEGVDAVVHLAARVHVMRESEDDPLTAFRQVNVRGTEQMLRHEGIRNVKRFVYLSSVKVHGEGTTTRSFSASDRLSPADPYARSKLEAEQLVKTVGSELGIETAIIRPPLVYGPGVGGNFVRLLDMIQKGIPLPFGLVKNSRSLVYVENLCDLICECLTHPLATGKRFLVSDNSDVSTPDLIRLIASFMSRPARLVPVPAAMLALAANLTGQSAAISRLIGSLQVNVGETMQTLSWKPPVSLSDGIHSTVDWYLGQQADA